MDRRVESQDRRRMPRRLVQLVVAAGISLLLGVAGIGLATSAASGQAVGSRLVPGFLPGLGHATLLGALPGSKTLEIAVGIQRPNTAGEIKLYDEMYSTTSPEYHHFLTVAQFHKEFGVSAATDAAVRRWLTGGGLKITEITGGDYLLATGTVTQLDKLFKLSINRYRFKQTAFYANNAAPSVPSNLPIDAVGGLQNLMRYSIDTLKGKQLARAKSEQAAIAAGRKIAKRYSVHPDLSIPSPQGGDEQTYTPQDLWGIYDDPGAAALTSSSSGLSDPTTVADSSVSLGQGQTMGVFGEGETSSIVRQLRLFEGTLGLPKVPVRTIETEGTPDNSYSDNSGAIEWYLDSQSSTGMAPDVKQLDFYFAKTFQDTDIGMEFGYWANDATGPREMNASFGECEQNPTQPVTGPLSNLPAGVGLGGEAEQLTDPSLRQAAMEGRTLFTSAGDTGSGCPEVYAPVAGAGNGLAIQPVPFQGYPCVSTYAVCVGGTVLSSKGNTYPTSAQLSAETSWTYSGGGSSYFNPQPTYQSGISAIDIPCVSDDTGTTVYNPATNPAPECRGVPDVADLSGNAIDDAYFIYSDGQPQSEGGTSLSSPLMMGQWARIQAAASATVQSAGGLGFANPTIYHQAKGADSCTASPCSDATYTRDFNDVTASEDEAGNGAFRPGPGWDYASGWGSLNVANFAKDVDGSSNAAVAYTGPEAAATEVCTATMTSPTGNATDPITDSQDAGVDITQATLTSSGANIVATLTVPSLSSGAPTEATDGANFYVTWEYGGTVYYANADEAETGGFTYTSGTTGPAFTSGMPNFGQFTATSGSKATGTTTSAGVITITIPASEVNSPPAGADLGDPQALVIIDAGAAGEDPLPLTVDSSDDLKGYSLDDGQEDSIGVNVVMDGTLGTNCTNTLPATSLPTTTTPGTTTTTTTPSKKPATSSTCTTKAAFVTHIKTKKFTTKGIRLSGTAKAHCPRHITHVSLAIARVVKQKCSFLQPNHHFGKFGSCAPHDYLKAKGTSTWSFSLKVRLPKGVYFLWEHAVDNKKNATRNVAKKHVFFRIA